MKTIETRGKQKIFSIFSNQAGEDDAHPFSGQFSPGKGQMLITLSGSGYAHADGSIMSIDLQFNGVTVLQSKAWARDANTHQSFVTAITLYNNTNDDPINYQILPSGNTVIDVNDFINLLVVVFEN